MTDPTLADLRSNFLDARKALADAQKYRKPEPVEDYIFVTRGFVSESTTESTASQDQSIRLSELFLDKSDLFVIHNMGISCNYCTLWADGLNGVLQHLSSRAAIVISSPDPVEVQHKFKTERNWSFNMVSTSANTFAEDMGYRNEHGYHPGVSVFSNTADAIYRVADTPFGPGDDFCAVWHLFDLLPQGANGWQPKFHYQS